jgi:AraC-like DNA-binding protein
MGIVVTLLPQYAFRQRLRTALEDRHEIVNCEDWGALARECDRTLARVAVIDLLADVPANFERVRRLRQAHPRLTLIAYVSPSPQRVREIFDAGRYGFAGLVVAGEDDAPRTLLSVIDQAEARALTGALRTELKELAPDALDAVLLAVTRAHERLSPVSLAKLLGRSPRALTRRLAAEGLPSPQRLLGWARLIVAAHLLEDSGRSADRVAATLGFPSGSAYRNTCQRYLQATPHEIRRMGGAGFVVRRFLAERDAVRAVAAGTHAGEETGNA